MAMPVASGDDFAVVGAPAGRRTVVNEGGRVVVTRSLDSSPKRHRSRSGSRTRRHRSRSRRRSGSRGRNKSRSKDRKERKHEEHRRNTHTSRGREQERRENEALPAAGAALVASQQAVAAPVTSAVPPASPLEDEDAAPPAYPCAAPQQTEAEKWFEELQAHLQQQPLPQSQQQLQLQPHPQMQPQLHVHAQPQQGSFSVALQQFLNTARHNNTERQFPTELQQSQRGTLCEAFSMTGHCPSLSSGCLYFHEGVDCADFYFSQNCPYGAHCRYQHRFATAAATVQTNPNWHAEDQRPTLAAPANKGTSVLVQQLLQHVATTLVTPHSGVPPVVEDIDDDDDITGLDAAVYGHTIETTEVPSLPGSPVSSDDGHAGISGAGHISDAPQPMQTVGASTAGGEVTPWRLYISPAGVPFYYNTQTVESTLVEANPPSNLQPPAPPQPPPQQRQPQPVPESASERKAPPRGVGAASRSPSPTRKRNRSRSRSNHSQTNGHHEESDKHRRHHSPPQLNKYNTKMSRHDVKDKGRELYASIWHDTQQLRHPRSPQPPAGSGSRRRRPATHTAHYEAYLAYKTKFTQATASLMDVVRKRTHAVSNDAVSYREKPARREVLSTPVQQVKPKPEVQQKAPPEKVPQDELQSQEEVEKTQKEPASEGVEFTLPPPIPDYWDVPTVLAGLHPYFVPEFASEAQATRLRAMALPQPQSMTECKSVPMPEAQATACVVCAAEGVLPLYRRLLLQRFAEEHRKAVIASAETGLPLAHSSSDERPQFVCSDCFATLQQACVPKNVF
eukprot:TRINITY_DN2227_c0_g1_i1.p1 TRINITY_DN2227_c0_g1~~TRINITY_DN2227_c0_g1_i1.p1  ORF type:complete len:878 (-),score=186.02 TRINITY_DN2227_c0_g1_i1:47-2416(-)